MKAIIWGINGQDGYYLDELLQGHGIEVIGIGRSGGGIKVNLANFPEVEKLVSDTNPDFIFHLAANSTTSHAAWQENHDTIATGSLHILQAVKQHSPATRVFLSGSGLQFRNTGAPIHETDPFEPTSMYAVSRINSVYTARYYRSLGVKVFVGYFFHHDSPRRGERHINKKIVDAAKRIANGSKEKFSIGDTSVRKEFGYAGDIVKAVWTMVQQDLITEAVIGTGVSHSIEEWLDISFSLHGLDWKQHTVKTEGFKSDYPLLVSEPSTIFSLGWSPEVTIENLAQMMNG